MADNFISFRLQDRKSLVGRPDQENSVSKSSQEAKRREDVGRRPSVSCLHPDPLTLQKPASGPTDLPGTFEI